MKQNVPLRSGKLKYYSVLLIPVKLQKQADCLSSGITDCRSCVTTKCCWYRRIFHIITTVVSIMADMPRTRMNNININVAKFGKKIEPPRKD